MWDVSRRASAPASSSGCSRCSSRWTSRSSSRSSACRSRHSRSVRPSSTCSLARSRSRSSRRSTSGRSDAAVIGVVALPWAVAVFLAHLSTTEKIDLGTSLVDAAVGLAANALGLSYLAPAALARHTEPAPSRRRVLIGGAAIAAVAALGGLPLSRALPALGTRLGNLPSAARHLVQAATLAPADADIDALAGITPRVTANEDHYVVDTTLVKPRVDIATWR